MQFKPIYHHAITLKDGTVINEEKVFDTIDEYEKFIIGILKKENEIEKTEDGL